MVISHLSLNNFRNYTKKSFSFSPATTILLGPNGSGKTNVLEALFLLATGKSFRAERDGEMILFEKELSRIQSEIIQFTSPTNPINKKINENNYESMNQLSKEERKLEIVLTTGSVHDIKTPFKQFKVNDVGKRMVDFVGNLKVVLFWPEDLELVTDSPSLRRRYLDFVLMQIDREYRRCLISYEKGVRQRNKLLEAIRDTGAHRHQLLFWDQLLIKNGDYISRKREAYLEFLNNKQSIISSQQFPRYQLIYDPSIISVQRLEQYKEEEVAAATTLVGPHRDDIKFKVQSSKFKVNDDELKDLSQYGSRGEQRLAILWLKLGELAFIEQTTGEKPVLLLDDIFSELDHPHREIVFEIIGKQQTILTAADEYFVEKGRMKSYNIVQLL